MKTIKLLFSFATISLILASCSTSYVPYAYDDLYYSPNNDPVKLVQKNPREDFNKTNNIQYDGDHENIYAEDETPSNYPQSIYQNRYSQAELDENNLSDSSQAGNYYDDSEVEYYDEDYSNTLQQLNSPVRSFDTYNSYQRDRILYTSDPFFTYPTVYGSYSFWDPIVPTTGLSVGWNSFSGWNLGFNVGYGYGRPFTYYGNPYTNAYNPYWGYNAWNDPFWGGGFGSNFGFGFGYGYGSNFGYGCSPYAAGYNRGFNNGFYGNNGGYYGGYGDYGSGRNNGRRQIKAARGNSGSRAVNGSSGNTRPTRPSRANRTQPSKSVVPNNRPSRATRTTSVQESRNGTAPSRKPRESAVPNRTPRESAVPNRTPRETTVPNNRPVRRQTTPQRYQTPRTPARYSTPRVEKPVRNTRPTNTRPATKPRVNPNAVNRQESRPTYNNRPRQNTYNRPTRVQPQQQARPKQQQTKPRESYSKPRQQQQSRPSNNYSRSKPSYNRSTPTYTAPKRSSGGSNNRPSRPSRR